MSTVGGHALVVEDESDVAALIKHTLEKDHRLTVTVAGSGDEALKAVSAQLPDLVVLDWNLPVLSGLEVCRILRQRTGTASLPILVVTARVGEEDRVLGLDAGADDYLTKPFGLRELSARVRALLRRARRPNGQGAQVNIYRDDVLAADFDAVSVSVNGAPVRLTRREFELLRFLVSNKNRVISRNRLLERVWGYDRDVETRSVDVHVGRLRAKLGDAGSKIETVVGLGYRFVS